MKRVKPLHCFMASKQPNSVGRLAAIVGSVAGVCAILSFLILNGSRVAELNAERAVTVCEVSKLSSMTASINEKGSGYDKVQDTKISTIQTAITPLNVFMADIAATKQQVIEIQRLVLRLDENRERDRQEVAKQLAELRSSIDKLSTRVSSTTAMAHKKGDE